MIMDTCFVIDVMGEDEKAIEKVRSLAEKGESFFITSITIFELFSGVVRSNRPEKEREKVIGVLGGQLILTLDDKSAEKAGDIDGKLINEGNQVKPLDCMIAGIALLKKDKVLTRNIKDFSRIKGLEIESY